MGVDDALEFFLAGASAVQVGTAIFAHPGVLIRLIDDLETWCRREGVRSLSEIVGAAHPQFHERASREADDGVVFGAGAMAAG